MRPLRNCFGLLFSVRTLSVMLRMLVLWCLSGCRQAGRDLFSLDRSTSERLSSTALVGSRAMYDQLRYMTHEADLHLSYLALSQVIIGRAAVWAGSTLYTTARHSCQPADRRTDGRRTHARSNTLSGCVVVCTEHTASMK